jgi:hypothetical protein
MQKNAYSFGLTNETKNQTKKDKTTTNKNNAFEDLTSEGFSEYRDDFEAGSVASESELFNTGKSSTFGTIGRKRI